MAPRNDSGQASIEHLGLIAVVALVLLAAGAISAIAAPGLLNRVTTTMQQAVCVVGGSACPTLGREACPVRREDRTRSTRLSFGIVRLADDRALTIEQRSDGSYVIGLAEGVGGGVGLTFGRGRLDASADGLLTGRAGRTWRAADRAAAQALVERLRRRALPAVEHVVRGIADLSGVASVEPGVESYTLSGRAAGSATANLGLGAIVNAGGEGDSGVELGVRIAAHRREVTAYVGLDGRVEAFFDALPALAVPRHGAHDRSRADDRDGGDDPLATVLNPGKLQQSGAAFGGGVIALRLAPGPKVTEIEVTATAGAGSGARELHVRLDPAIPEVAAALEAWRRAPADAGRLAELGRAAAGSASVDERRFALSMGDREYGGEVGVGPSLGLTAVKGLKVLTLRSQRSRPAGGVWEQRLDCEVV
jgi:Flp pilus assembly pilin Flp